MSTSVLGITGGEVSFFGGHSAGEGDRGLFFFFFFLLETSWGRITRNRFRFGTQFAVHFDKSFLVKQMRYEATEAIVRLS